MCGRYVLSIPIADLAEFFDAAVRPEVEDRPSWNIAPTTKVPGIALSDDGKVMGSYRWGLVPMWAKDLSYGARTINARAETVATLPSFRDAFVRRRLLVPAEAYYEWSTIGGPKRPYAFKRRDGAPLVFAGLWEAWRDPRADTDEAWVRTLAIITTAPNEDIEIHDRMPAILERDAWDRWLDPGLRDRDELEAMLRPAPRNTLLRQPVDPRVGSVANDGPELLEEPATLF